MTVTVVGEAPERVLAIYAHPDDPDISCGGTLARWTSAGARVEVIICAKGDKGAADRGTDVDALVRERSAEATRSAEVLGLSGVHLLDRLDGDLENDAALRAELVRLIRAATPEVIVTPDPTAVFFGEHHFNHRDHRVVGWAALDAAAPAAASPLYFPECGPAHQVKAAYLSGSLEPNVFVDVAETIGRKIEAVACHRSQLRESGEWIADALRDSARQTGYQAGLDAAESFRRIWLGP